MKNFSSGKSTLIGQIDSSVKFEKGSDYAGKYEKGQFKVLGYLKTFSKKFKVDQYSLFVELGDIQFLMNVPNWYGEALAEDFQDSDQTAEEYFKDAFIEKIETYTTEYGTTSIRITIFE